jgi:hypothetical protein
MVVNIPADKVKELLNQIKTVASAKKVTLNQLQSLCGLLAFCTKALPAVELFKKIFPYHKVFKHVLCYSDEMKWFVCFRCCHIQLPTKRSTRRKCFCAKCKQATQGL